MQTLAAIADGDLRSAIVRFRDALRDHQAAINRLNVYPVPDGDTGTNMALTVESVVAELDGAPPGMEGACQAISHGSLMGARGNSGAILSQLLRGLCEVIRTEDAIDGGVLASALTAASAKAYEAVMKPVEGTILTVLRESAAAAVAADADAAPGDGALLLVLEATRAEAAASLERTPDLLPVLAQAGVVDAGGAGYLLLLDVLLHVVDRRPVPEPDEADEPVVVADHGDDHDHDHDHDGLADLRYEVMYLLDVPDEAIPAFKDVWATLGDSIVVVGGDGLWNCHIHTDDIGPSIEAALDIGRPWQIRITDLIEQVEEERWVRDAESTGDTGPEPERPVVTTAVVAVCAGDGIARIFHAMGAQEVVTGGQTMNPSTAMLLEAVERAPAPSVVILPNNKNIIAVAEQVDEQTDKVVRVVPTEGALEGFRALLDYDPLAPVDDVVAVLAQGAAAVLASEVTHAVRDSTCDLGPITQGDFLGIARDGIRAVEPTVADAAVALLAALVDDDHEILTVIEGEGASTGDTRRIAAWLEEHHPDVEAEVHHGGQPLYPYLFGLE